MTERTYLKRRAEQEAELAVRATHRRGAAAHDAITAAYFRKIAQLAAEEERRLEKLRPAQV